MKITVCGGGSLGHVCIGVLSQCAGVEVSLLTQRPGQWSSSVVVTDCNEKTLMGHLCQISSDPARVIPSSDIVLLCVPGFLIEKTLLQIKPYLTAETKVGTVVSSTGFFFVAHRVLPAGTKLFGFQRVPFIARVAEYGHSAHLLGYKPSVAVAAEGIDDAEGFCQVIERLFATPAKMLDSYLEVSLTNSNPILHTGRLYSLWGQWDGTPFDRCLLFYKEWSIEASERLIKMDAEFMELLKHLPMNPKAIPSLLEYYESQDAESLTRKLQSIQAFQNIAAPMKQLPEGGWVPDFESRYFTEDFPYGLKYIVTLAKEYKVSTPCMDEVLAWGMSKLR